jgi:hypothetical protein
MTAAATLWATLQGESWDDLRFPVQNLRVNPSTSKPDFDFDTGTYRFDAADTESVVCIAQLPHSWLEGSILRPHVHWYKTTAAAGNVYWQLSYKWAPIGAVIDASPTVLFSATAAVSDANTANHHAITALGDISGAGKKGSACLIMTVSRVGGNAADTYAADAALIEFDLHYQVYGLGSPQEYPT